MSDAHEPFTIRIDERLDVAIAVTLTERLRTAVDEPRSIARSAHHVMAFVTISGEVSNAWEFLSFHPERRRATSKM